VATLLSSSARGADASHASGEARRSGSLDPGDGTRGRGETDEAREEQHTRRTRAGRGDRCGCLRQRHVTIGRDRADDEPADDEPADDRPGIAGGRGRLHGGTPALHCGAHRGRRPPGRRRQGGAPRAAGRGLGRDRPGGRDAAAAVGRARQGRPAGRGRVGAAPVALAIP
jgi:hypothetical protein